MDRELVESQCSEEVVDDERGLDVGEKTRRADRVEVTLHELAVPPPLGVLSAPHRADVIALEGSPGLTDVLRDEPRQRHRQIEAHRDVAAAAVLEPIELLVGLVSALAEQDLGVFEGRGIDRAEPV
jgi:hypothetical protein